MVRLFFIAALAALPVFSQTASRGGAMNGSVHRSERQPEAALQSSARSIRNLEHPRRKVTLRALSREESKPVSRKPGLTAIGTARSLPEDVLSQGEWSITAEGRRVWRLAVESPGAETLRLRFAGFNAGEGNVWLLAPDGTTASGPYTGKGPFGDGDFWSDIVPGVSLIVAYEPPINSTAEDIPFRLTEVSHRIATAKTQTSARLASAASCALDASCYPEYHEPAEAVALLLFESEGKTYQCSGALVASKSADPLFLTANHCISTDAEARSAITIFQYQTSSCNGAVPALSSLPRVAGASLLHGSPMELGDFTLLRLNRFPDIDVHMLGWYAEEITRNEQVTGISHPAGDYKRIALGQRSRDARIRFSDGAEMPAEKGIQVTWFQGLTQGGSSGSPLLAEINGGPYLVGTLSAGPDIDDDDDRQVCRTRNTIASYGRFASAFPYLAPFLTAAASGQPGVSTRRATLTASPDIVTLLPGQAVGTTTLSWQASDVSRVQIRVLSPTGPAMTGIEGASGSAVTGDWVTDGMQFYLQDASSGDSSGAEKTLAIVQVSVTP